MAPVYSNLQFPERAEFLEEYGDRYSVHLEPWGTLREHFAVLLRAVHSNVTSRLLFICGEQGSGKSLFCKRLHDGHAETSQALGRDAWTPSLNKNLWEMLAVDDRSRAEEIVRTVTPDTVVHRVDEEEGWLKKLLLWAEQDQHKVRVVVLDNFHHVPFLSELAGLDLTYYTGLRRGQEEGAAFDGLAQNLVRHARGVLRRSIFVCTANDTRLMEQLHGSIAREWREMASLLEVPKLEPAVKERVARTNLNRLNPVSYWHTLDRTQPEQLAQVHEALTGEASVGRVYECVSRASVTAQGDEPGRPHWFTLVTLGSPTAEVKSRIDRDWEGRAPKVLCFNERFGVWSFRNGFASALRQRGEEARRCKLFDSEFEVCWVALDMRATHALVAAPPTVSDVGQQLFRLLLGVHKGVTKNTAEALAATLDALPEDVAWGNSFRDRGMSRYLIYEPQLAVRAQFESVVWDQPHPNHPSVLPDIQVKPCAPCELSKASTADAVSLRDAIAREGHVVEFTSFQRRELDGISAYILSKVTETYAPLLEEL